VIRGGVTVAIILGTSTRFCGSAPPSPSKGTTMPSKLRALFLVLAVALLAASLLAGWKWQPKGGAQAGWTWDPAQASYVYSAD
jgi:hypothetical protein